MLAEKFAADAPLPQVGSVGYLRGTAQRARVIRRNAAPSAGGERTCLVQLFERCAQVAGGGSAQGRSWWAIPGSSGNTVVEERDLFATEDEAMFGGRKPRRRVRRER